MPIVRRSHRSPPMKGEYGRDHSVKIGEIGGYDQKFGFSMYLL
jgi:hypothetical protein